MLDPIYEAIAWLLAQFYSVVPNLGVSIILLTFTIMLLLYPLTAKQAKSMIAMQRVQPEIKKMQAKYKNDRQKLNEEMMKFYQENKINPLAGCLPLLVQLPIFFSLFRVLREAYKYVPKSSTLYSDLCTGFGKLQSNGTWSKCGVDLTRGLKASSSSQYDGLNIGDAVIHHLKFLGTDLQKTAVDAHNGILNAAPYFVLVALVILTGFLQTRQAQKRTPVANKQMGMVMKILPIFFGLISLQFPAGLVLYFFVSNLWRLGQQEVIFRSVGTASKPAVGKGAKPVLEVESRDTTPDESTDPSDEMGSRRPTPPRGPAKRPARTSATPTPGGPAAERSGLRGLFQLPPPPDGNAGGAARPTPSAKGGGGPRASSPAKPPPPRNRSKKKKRRR